MQSNFITVFIEFEGNCFGLIVSRLYTVRQVKKDIDVLFIDSQLII